ncbi:MAG TPA: glycine zipper domain-containing protein [Gemmatimonadales bacterium]
MTLTTASEINSNRNKAGDQFTATLDAAVTDASGRTVIPAGSSVTFQIVQIEEAENQGGDGKLVLRTVDATVNGESHLLKGEVTTLKYELKSGGVSAGDVGKVAVGAVAGAILGRVLGRSTTGAVVGGVVGAAVGTVIAVKTVDRDVVVPAGSKITLRLTESFSRPG